MYADTLKLIVTGDRRHPSPRLPERLNGLFRSLGDASGGRAERIEDEIWRLWMAYRDSAAAFDLERATRALTALDFPAAEGILARLVAAHPDFAEAWNKRATLYYMQSRDEESVASIHRTLELEPRHYGAICGFAQIRSASRLEIPTARSSPSTRRCASTLTWRACARRSTSCSAPAGPPRFTEDRAGANQPARYM